MRVLKPGAIFNIQPVCGFLLTCLFLQICSCAGAAALQPCLRDTGAAQGSLGWKHAADGPGRARCKGGQSPRILFYTALLPSIRFTNGSKLLLRMMDERDAASGEEEPKTRWKLCEDIRRLAHFHSRLTPAASAALCSQLICPLLWRHTQPILKVRFVGSRASTRVQKQQASMRGNGGKALGFQHGLDVAPGWVLGMNWSQVNHKHCSNDAAMDSSWITAAGSDIRNNRAATIIRLEVNVSALLLYKAVMYYPGMFIHQ